ncbi:MAG: chemotaxis protein CheY [Nitrospira bacterium SG8_3]|nr:MAG: chemotaxis protein CheY [Nitrospira bacterium SG8_3]
MAKKRILVVGDELDMRTFVCTLLGTCGYQSLVASDGEEGIQKAKKLRPQLIILDVMLPKEGGIQMYRELKTDDNLKDIPVIMLSGISKKTFFHSQNILNSYMGQSLPEPEAYIEKPPESEELIQLAESLMAGER